MPTATLRHLSLGLLLAGASIVAAPAHTPPGHRPGGPARAEIRAYVAANVLPTLRQQRRKLEAQLAPADQLALAGYRARLQALQESAPAPHDPLAPPPTAEQREQARVQFGQIQEIMGQVRELARKYQPNIEQLAAAMQPQRARWATDVQALAMQQASPEQQAHLARRPGFAAHHGELGRLLKPSAFLLLEPAAPAENTLLGTSLYPNPATASSQLQYEVKQAGPVRVELLDAQGQLLRPLLPTTTQQPGTYTQPLDLGDLPKGTYFYKVTTEGGSATRRFVRE